MSNTPDSGQEYLSIGDALDLLKPEFPEITISKIRFFEGQGLIEPERTPSGFRKFTIEDLERLRWVLRQQQESYLPLRVLRERLEAAEASGVVPHKQVPAKERSGGSTRAPHGGGPDARAALQDPGADDTDDLGAGPSSQEALDATPETLGEFRHPAARARSAGLRPGSPTASGRTAASVIPEDRALPGEPPSTPAPSAALPPGLPPEATPTHANASSTASPSSPSEGPVPPKATSDPGARLGSHNPMLGAAGGGAMAFHELAAASGLSLDDLRQLEEFGLITGRQMYDGRYYGGDALAVAKSVVAFRAFGVEPRHLRMYKASADREAAFFAQVLSPSLHRRGEEAKTKVAGTLIELRRLGEQIREVVLDQALRDLTDGRS